MGDETTITPLHQPGSVEDPLTEIARDGAVGFWKALDEVFPGTCLPRCWVYKTANVVNTLPKFMHPAMKADLRDIWQAGTRAAAEAALDTFTEKYGTTYEKAVTCLSKDREALLAHYAFPSEH